MGKEIQDWVWETLLLEGEASWGNSILRYFPENCLKFGTTSLNLPPQEKIRDCCSKAENQEATVRKKKEAQVLKVVEGELLH
jgi:hypothetical protein